MNKIVFTLEDDIYFSDHLPGAEGKTIVDQIHRYH